MRALAAIALVVVSACVVPESASRRATEPTRIAPVATASPAPAAVRGQPPLAVGADPEAGVIFLRGADDWIYRYDGMTGQLSRATRHATIQLATADGIYAAGLEGGLTLLRWDGRVEPVDCGPGRFQLMLPSRDCLSYDTDAAARMVWVRSPGDAVARVLLDDLPAGGFVSSGDGRRAAVLRRAPGPTPEERAHNELWLVEVGGGTRRLYEPGSSEAFIVGPRWSPDGRWLTAFEIPIYGNSAMADGGRLLLIDTRTGAIVDLGKALPFAEWIQWSSDGRLAFVRGGDRQTWFDKTLVVRSSDGSEIALTDPDHVGLAPAWSTRPDGMLEITWIEAQAGDGNGGVYVGGTGPGSRYPVVSDLQSTPRRVAFPGLVEGIRPATDGYASLVLLRRPSPPGRDIHGALDLWLMKPPGSGIATQVPLVSGLGDLAFGFYGRQPSLFDLVAWSRDLR